MSNSEVIMIFCFYDYGTHTQTNKLMKSKQYPSGALHFQ